MSWITPLGFLGLISIGVLILIYILKPNYQKKVISSTFVWKLSLKYKKKRFPINRFRNLLIFICQVLALTAGSLILAGPIVKGEDTNVAKEKILIIESSANMLSEWGGKTRFERAIDLASDEAKKLLEDENGLVSIIVADSTPAYLFQRVDVSALEDVDDTLEALYSECSYGTADIEGAISLAESVLRENQDSEIVLYTATKYLQHDGVTVEDVSMDGEWNAAILSCKAKIEDGYYVFEAEVACYGANRQLVLYCDVYGANETGETIKFTKTETYKNDETLVVQFKTNDEDNKRVFSYEYVCISFKEADAFLQDNTFYIYGGKREELKIQYASPEPNIFVAGSLMTLRSAMGDRWDISITELNTAKNGEPELEGYDLYIFEHEMPDMMPTDGIVFLINPDSVPSGLDIILGGEGLGPLPLTHGVESPITQYISPENIELTKYERILAAEGFSPLLYCGADPVFMVRNEEAVKVAIMSFSVHYTQAPVTAEFPLLFMGLYEYFLPTTLTEFSFNVEDTVSLNARGATLSVNGPGVNTKLEEFPAKLTVTKPGIYTLLQTKLNGIEVVENFFVKTPASESNLFKEKDILVVPYVEKKVEQIDLDLLIYFAAAMVALLFIEWLLQSSDV